MLIAIKLLLLFSLFDNEIKVEVKKFPKELTPGKHHILMLKITNNSKEIITPQLEFDFPKEWKLISKSSDIKINPNSSRIVIHTIHVPKRAKQGDYQIPYTVNFSNNYSYKNIIETYVKKVSDLNITTIKQPKYLKNETDFSCIYMIENNGNTKEKIELDSKFGNIQGDNFRIIPINSTINVTVNQKVPQNINEPIKILNDINLKISTNDSLITKNTLITVYPNSKHRHDLYHRYPIKTQLSNLIFKLNDSTINLRQYQINGNGFIDKNNKHYLGVNVRGTDQPNFIRFETYNRINIKYKYQNIELEAGDVSITFSRLLEQLRLGKGFNIINKRQKSHHQLFANQLTFYKKIKNQIGYGYTRKISDSLNLNIRTILKNYANNEGISLSNSLSSSLQKKHSFLKNEVAISVRDNQVKSGIYNEYLYKKNNLNINNSILITQAGFEGFFENTNQISSSNSYKINNKTFINLSANYNLINPKNDDIVEQVIPFSQNYSVNLGYTKGIKTKHSLGIAYRSNVDRSNLNKFNYNESFLRYSFKYNNSKTNLILNSNIALTNNLQVTEQNKKGISSTLQLLSNIKVNHNLNISGDIDYSYTNRYTEQSNQFLFYGFKINYNYKGLLKLDFGFKNNYPLEELYQNNSFLNTNISYQISKNHQISFNGRFDSPLNDTNINNSFLSFNYLCNINLPIWKDKNTGHLVGEIKSRYPKVKEGVVVFLDGYSTVSDYNGYFEFIDIPSGKHYMTIDQSTIKKNLITIKELPLEVEIKSQKFSETNFYLIAPSKVRGEIIYKKTNQIQHERFKNELPQLIIKLKNGEDEYYTTVDPKKKTFLFSEIKPGTYQISIVTKGLEKKFEFIRYSRQIELRDGIVTTVKFEIKDKSRKMKFNSKKFNLKLNKWDVYLS